MSGTCKWNGNLDACGNETCWDLGKCQGNPPMSEEKTAEGFLTELGYLNPTMYGLPYNQIKVSELMQTYADQQSAALKEVIKELIPMAEEMLRLPTGPDTFIKTYKGIDIKAAVERAKLLTNEEGTL